MEKKLYYCDPSKNHVCRKTNCAYLHPYGECRLTTHNEFAKNDDYEILQQIKAGKGLKPLL